MVLELDPPMSFESQVLSKLIELAIAIESGDPLNLSDSIYREINSSIVDKGYPYIREVANWICNCLFARFHKIPINPEPSFQLYFSEYFTIVAIRKSIAAAAAAADGIIKKPIHLVFISPNHCKLHLQGIIRELACIKKVTWIVPAGGRDSDDKYYGVVIRKLMAENGGDIVKCLDQIVKISSCHDAINVVVWMYKLNTLLDEPGIFEEAMLRVKILKPELMFVFELEINLNCDNFTKRLAEVFHLNHYSGLAKKFWSQPYETLVRWTRRLDCAGFSQIPFRKPCEGYEDYEGGLIHLESNHVVSKWRLRDDHIIDPFNRAIGNHRSLNTPWKLMKKWSKEKVQQYLTSQIDDDELLKRFQEWNTSDPLKASLHNLIIPPADNINAFLNDEQYYVNQLVIDEYFELLKRRSDEFPNLYLKHYSLSTYTSKFVLEENWDLLKKHFKIENNLDYIQDASKLFMPVCIQKHWILICIDMELRMILCLDSVESIDHHRKEKEMLCKWVNEYILRKSGYPQANWTFHEVVNIPRQTNSVDCGVFVMKYADCLCHGDYFPFTQDDMNHFRRSIAFDILCCKKIQFQVNTNPILDIATQKRMDTTKASENCGQKSSKKRKKNQSSGKRSNQSIVWEKCDKVIDEDGNKWAICKICKKKYPANSKKTGTTSLLQHVRRCSNQLVDFPQNDSLMNVVQNHANPELNGSMTDVVQNQANAEPNDLGMINVAEPNSSFYQETSSLDLAEMIIKHGCPLNMAEHFQVFVKKLLPLFKIGSQDDIKADVLRVYKAEKEKQLFKYHSNLYSRFSLTVDLRSYGEKKIIHCCLILCFIDDEWELKQIILAFKNLGDTVTPQTLREVIQSVLSEWNIDKNILLVVANDVSFANYCMSGEFSSISTNLSFVPCEQLINILVADIELVTANFHKLQSVVECFPDIIQLQHSDSDFTKEFEKGIDICKKLKEFHESVCTSAGMDVLFESLIYIYNSLLEWKKSENSYVRKETKSMTVKFDKYWDEFSLALGIMAVLDPRFKLSLVEYAYEQIFDASSASSKFSKFRDFLGSTYDRYANASNHKTQSSSSTSTLKAANFRKWKELKGYSSIAEKKKNEVDIYLEEDVVELEKDSDVLAWWRANAGKYPVLSRMARDYLAVSMSNIESKSSQIKEIMKMNPGFDELQPEVTEALICGQDWL